MRLPVLCLCTAVLLGAFPSPARAQTSNAECRPSASRGREGCEPAKAVLATETEVSFTLELPPPKSAQCAAMVEIEYTQRDTNVSVEGTISHQDCAASNGEHRFTVSVRDQSLELKTLEFVESWQRQDDQPVKLKVSYPIGENVDLVRVRARQLRCTCADRPPE
jgi:hypothetical protein